MSTPSSSTKSSPVQQLVDSTIDSNLIAVFSKSWCPYCSRAKTLISSIKLPDGKGVKIIELDQRNDGSQIQNYLKQKTGQSTVPNIFINRQHIGGSSDLVEAHSSGKVKKLIEQAG